MRDTIAVDMDGRGDGKKLGRVEEREIVVRIYYVKKRLFQ